MASDRAVHASPWGWLLSAPGVPPCSPQAGILLLGHSLLDEQRRVWAQAGGSDSLSPCPEPSKGPLRRWAGAPFPGRFPALGLWPGDWREGGKRTQPSQLASEPSLALLLWTASLAPSTPLHLLGAPTSIWKTWLSPTWGPQPVWRSCCRLPKPPSPSTWRAWPGGPCERKGYVAPSVQMQCVHLWQGALSDQVSLRTR